VQLNEIWKFSKNEKIICHKAKIKISKF